MVGVRRRSVDCAAEACNLMFRTNTPLLGRCYVMQQTESAQMPPCHGCITDHERRSGARRGRFRQSFGLGWIRPVVGGQITSLRANESYGLGLQERTLDARMSERPATAQYAAGVHDAMRRYIVRAVAHRPTNHSRVSHPSEQPTDGPIGGDAARRHSADEGVYLFGEGQISHTPIVASGDVLTSGDPCEAVAEARTGHRHRSADDAADVHLVNR